MIIQIQPVPAFPNSGVQLDVHNGNVILGDTASFLYTVLDVSGDPVSVSRRVSMTTGQYENWVGGDEYVCACIAENVGLVPITGG